MNQYNYYDNPKVVKFESPRTCLEVICSRLVRMFQHLIYNNPWNFTFPHRLAEYVAYMQIFHNGGQGKWHVLGWMAQLVGCVKLLSVEEGLRFWWCCPMSDGYALRTRLEWCSYWPLKELKYEEITCLLENFDSNWFKYKFEIKYRLLIYFIEIQNLDQNFNLDQNPLKEEQWVH